MSALKKVLVAVAAVAVLVVGGTWVYINLIRDDAPERLTLDERVETPAADDDGSGLAGTWAAGEGSEAGYRVEEILFGQNATAVGHLRGRGRARDRRHDRHLRRHDGRPHDGDQRPGPA